MKHVHLILFLLLLIPAVHIQSQNKKIKGIVFSTENKPVEDVLVTVINRSDNTIYTTFSDSLGFYLLEGSFADSVYIEVGTLNSKKEIRSLNLSFGENVVDTIFIEDNLLDEVVVTAGAYFVKRETDKLLMNINPQSNLIKNSNIWNAMRVVPSVSVSEMEGLSMLGKQNVSIFINGRKSMLSFTALKSYMESMPAENIKSIELIYNPGAVFNVGSNTGVINIILRKPEGNGLKGMASVSTWQTHYNKQIASLNLNYKKDKVSVISSFSGRNLHDWSASVAKKEFMDIQQEIEEKGSSNNKRPVLIGNVDMAYELNKRNKIGFVIGAEYVNFHPDRFTTSSYKQTGSHAVDSFLNASLDGSYTYYKSKIPEIGTSKSVFNGGAKVSGTFIPSKLDTWQFVSDVQYRSPFKTMVWYYSSSLRGSIEISKRMNDFTVSMYGFYSLQYSDGGFGTKLKSNYSVGNYTSHSISEGEYSGLMLSAVYRFGNNKVRNGAKRVTSASSIQNRLNDNK